MPIDAGGNHDRPGTGATTSALARIESGAADQGDSPRPGALESHAMGDRAALDEVSAAQRQPCEAASRSWATDSCEPAFALAWRMRSAVTP